MAQSDDILLIINACGYPTDQPNTTTDFVGYYLDRRQNYLKEFQDLFELAKLFDEKRKNSLWGYITSSWTRFEYVLFAKDQINKVHKTPINNNSQFLIETFMYNFIITLYSLLDSLAWIIHHWYKLNLPRMQITLNFSSKDELKKKIQLLNKPLADYLEKGDIQDWINYIQDYRDCIQHRQRVQIMPEYNETLGYKRMVIELKPGLHQFYPNLSYDSFEEAYMPVWEKYGTTMEPVNDFCDKHFSKLLGIIENVSKCIKAQPN